MRSLLPFVPLFALLAGTSSAQSFDYPDFSSMTGLSVVGMTVQSGAIAQLQDNLVPAVGSDNRGALWYSTPVGVASGFVTTFEYQMHTPSTTGGSDGMAFVIQNDTTAGVPIVNGAPDGVGNQALGRHASAAGFGAFTGSAVGESVGNSVAIHLDTYNNGTWGDLNANHISIHTGGNGDNSQDETFSLGRANPAIDLNDGSVHTIAVNYTPGTLEVYVDGGLELSVAYDFATGGTHVDGGTPVGGLDLINGTDAYVGFTASAGGAREFKEVHSWSFGPAACGCTQYCQATTNSTGVAAGLVAGGSSSISANDLVLIASDMPAQPGIFIAGPSQAQIPFFNGFLCVSPTGLQRFSSVAVPTGGAVTEAVDIASSVPGGLNVAAGQPYYYQRWFRDPAAGGGNANFSIGVEVMYVP